MNALSVAIASVPSVRIDVIPLQPPPAQSPMRIVPGEENPLRHRRQQIDQPVGNGHHTSRARIEHNAVGGVIDRPAASDRVDRCALLDRDAALWCEGHQEYLGASQMRATADIDDGGLGLKARKILGVIELKSTADQQPRRAKRIEVVGVNRQAGMAGRRRSRRRRGFRYTARSPKWYRRSRRCLLPD